MILIFSNNRCRFIKVICKKWWVFYWVGSNYSKIVSTFRRVSARGRLYMFDIFIILSASLHVSPLLWLVLTKLSRNICTSSRFASFRYCNECQYGILSSIVSSHPITISPHSWFLHSSLNLSTGTLLKRRDVLGTIQVPVFSIILPRLSMEFSQNHSGLSACL